MAESVTGWKRGAHSVANGGKNFSSMARECTFTWDNSSTVVYSDAFDWVVDHDFTIIINVDAVDSNATDGLDVVVQGSGTGDTSNNDEWADLGTFANVDEHAVSKFCMYDFDTNGRAPFMRLKCTPSSTINPVATGGVALIRVMVIPHVT